MARTYLSFVALVDIIGEADATALCREYGGFAIYVSKRPERSHLAGTISGCAVENLCSSFGGEEVMLARGPFRPVPIKEAIVAMLEAGASIAETAKEVGCTVRYVAMVRANLTPCRKPAAPRRRTECKA
ncbi:MAG TPA: hypothetical protein DGF30_13045 [Desulfomicrobium sp.]|nr:hypothetical protein [Desulfomicrobium sp.]